MQRLVLFLLLLGFTACGRTVPTSESRPATAPDVAQKQRGLSYAAASPRRGTYGTESSAASLKNARALGVDWISVMPFGFQRNGASIAMGGWETDDSIRATILQAHALEIRVLLKPHLWSREQIRYGDFSPEDWDRWFAGYETFLVHFATLARDANADALSIGNELKDASKHEARWRTLIARVRAIYSGPITYGANFDEVFHVPFWDALDWIGVSAYFPLTPSTHPTREELIAAWQPIAAQLEGLAAKHGKPVLFTEIGYRSANGAAWRQWEIPRDAPLNVETQRIAYEAFFETMWPRPWLLGAYPWKWFSYPGHTTNESNDYEFEGKPAMEVIRRAYTSGR